MGVSVRGGDASTSLIGASLEREGRIDVAHRRVP
jgi:hypothetical protein